MFGKKYTIVFIILSIAKGCFCDNSTWPIILTGCLMGVILIVFIIIMAFVLCRVCKKKKKEKEDKNKILIQNVNDNHFTPIQSPIPEEKEIDETPVSRVSTSIKKIEKTVTPEPTSPTMKNIPVEAYRSPTPYVRSPTPQLIKELETQRNPTPYAKTPSPVPPPVQKIQEPVIIKSQNQEPKTPLPPTNYKNKELELQRSQNLEPKTPLPPPIHKSQETYSKNNPITEPSSPKPKIHKNPVIIVKEPQPEFERNQTLEPTTPVPKNSTILVKNSVLELKRNPTLEPKTPLPENKGPVQIVKENQSELQRNPTLEPKTPIHQLNKKHEDEDFQYKNSTPEPKTFIKELSNVSDSRFSIFSTEKELSPSPLREKSDLSLSKTPEPTTPLQDLVEKKLTPPTVLVHKKTPTPDVFAARQAPYEFDQHSESNDKIDSDDLTDNQDDTLRTFDNSKLTEKITPAKFKEVPKKQNVIKYSTNNPKWYTLDPQVDDTQFRPVKESKKLTVYAYNPYLNYLN